MSPVNEFDAYVSLAMDRDTPIGNSEDTFGRRALHVKIGNKLSEPLPVSLSGGGATTPTIYNLPMPLANTEYSLAVLANTKCLEIRCRGNARIQLAFTPGDTAVNYITIRPGVARNIDGILFTGKTLYVQSSLPGMVLEVLQLT